MYILQWTSTIPPLSQSRENINISDPSLYSLDNVKIVLKERRWRCSQYLPDNYLATQGKAWEKASSDVFKIPEKLVILSSEVTGELEPQMLKQSWKRSILKVTGKEKKCRWWLHQTETAPNYFVLKSLARNPVEWTGVNITSPLSHTLTPSVILAARPEY